MVFVNWVYLGLLALGISCVDAISTISIKGAKFFDTDGHQVFFKGIHPRPRGIGVDDVGMAYQRSPYDPFVNETQCQLDASLMQKLGVNAIRCTYHPVQVAFVLMASVSC